MTSKPGEAVPQPGQPAVPAAEQPRTFTQEEVNTLVGKVRSEERGKYADYEELKTKATAFDGQKKAQLTETERMRQDLAEAQRARADAELRVASTAIDAEIRTSAMGLGFINPGAVLRLVSREGIKYSEETGVSGVQEALAALKISDPYLIAPAGAGARVPNLNPARGTPGQGRTLTEDQRDAARRMRLTEEEYAKGLLDTT